MSVVSRRRTLYEALSASLIFIGLLGFSTYMVYQKSLATLQQEIKIGLQSNVRSAASTLSGEMHQKITAQTARDDPLYQQLAQQLERIRQASQDVRYIYTTVLDHERVRFVVNPSPQNDNDGDGNADLPPALMQEYENAPSELLAALHEQRAGVSEQPYRDQWGVFISAYAPFYDLQGRFSGVLAMDLELSRFYQRLGALNQAFRKDVIIILFLGLVVGLTVWGLRRSSQHPRPLVNDTQKRPAVLVSEAAPQQQKKRPVGAIALLIGQTFLIQLVSGINYVTLPILLSQQGNSNLWIGVAMACEIIGVLLFHRPLSRFITGFGLAWSTLLLIVVRAALCFSMAGLDNYYGWLLVILAYGLCTGMQLILLQTWLNQLPLRRRGMVMGLYSAALSLGVALGPVLLQLLPLTLTQRFWLTAGLSLCPVLLVGYALTHPQSHSVSSVHLGVIFRHARAIFLSALVGGVSFYGLPNFLTLYGINDGLSEERASLLMTLFMLGSVTLGMLMSVVSDWVNRQWIVVFCIFCSVVCAVFLALAVYADYGTTLGLLFLWGGSMGGIYSIGLSLIGDRFHTEQQMSANMSYTLMDALGGILGLVCIGLMMDLIGSEGMTLVLVVVGCIFLCYLVWELAEHKAPFR